MIFARHQTFQPRFGWLQQSFHAVVKNPHLFSDENNHLELGVGKNMAQAIRYWLEAFKLVEPDPDKKGCLRPTAIGSRLFDENSGLDPYLESETSLWLLHWLLLKPECQATAWYFLFNEYSKIEFSAETAVKSLNEWVKKEDPSKNIAISSIKKDINIILRMYIPQEENTFRSKKKGFEETLDSIFSNLRLIRKGKDKGEVSFSHANEDQINSYFIGFCVLDFIASKQESARTYSLQALMSEPGSPGKVLRITGNKLQQALSECAEKSKKIVVSESAGIEQVSVSGDIDKLADKFLEYAY